MFAVFALPDNFATFLYNRKQRKSRPEKRSVDRQNTTYVNYFKKSGKSNR